MNSDPVIPYFLYIMLAQGDDILGPRWVENGRFHVRSESCRDISDERFHVKGVASQRFSEIGARTTLVLACTATTQKIEHIRPAPSFYESSFIAGEAFRHAEEM